jgi:16S rRNA (cytosine1402-N4)-methyltransferase
MPHHSPCMLRETLEWLDPQPGQIIADLTVGLGGHGREIIQRIGPEGIYLGLEWDPETFALAQQELGYHTNVHLYNENFLRLPEVMADAGIRQLDGAMLDAGVNMVQLSSLERSMAQDSELGLDMRHNRSAGEPAEVLINEASEERLREVFRITLQEREARSIARAIVRARSREAIRTTRRLSEVILSTLSPQARRSGRQPAPALLAVRCAINDEIPNLEAAIGLVVDALRPGGKFVGLSFHSAEFRVFRQVFRRLAHPCECDPRMPCSCGLKPRVKVLAAKPPGPDEASLKLSGPSCRSARLHALQAL